MKKLKALKNFSSPKLGHIAADDEFECDDQFAESLVESKFAKPVADKKAVAKKSGAKKA